MIILVIEDDPVQGASVDNYLASHGHKVEWSSNGRSAVVKAGVARPDAVLLDLCLPDVGAVNMLAMMSELAPRVVVLSAIRGESLDELRADFRDVIFLEKPQEPEAILAALEGKPGERP